MNKFQASVAALSLVLLTSCANQTLNQPAAVENPSKPAPNSAPPKTVDLATLDPALHYKLTVPSNYRVESVESHPNALSRCLIYFESDSNPDLEFCFWPHGFSESALEGAGLSDEQKQLAVSLERGNPDLATQQYVESVSKTQQAQAGLAPKNLGTPSVTPTVIANTPMKKVSWTEQDGNHFAIFGRDDLGEIYWEDIPHYDDANRTAESQKIPASLVRN